MIEKTSFKDTDQRKKQKQVSDIKVSRNTKSEEEIIDSSFDLPDVQSKTASPIESETSPDN